MIIAIILLVIAGYWLNSGGFQAWALNHDAWFESPTELLSRKLFLFVMSGPFGIFCVFLAFLLCWREPKGEFWPLVAAWTAGWWIGNFFYPRLSTEEREWLREKLGGKKKK